MRVVLIMALAIGVLNAIWADNVIWPGPAEKVTRSQEWYVTISGLSKLPGDWYTIVRHVAGESGAPGTYAFTKGSADRVSFRIMDNTNLWSDYFYIAWDPALARFIGKSVAEEGFPVDIGDVSGGAKQTSLDIPGESIVWGFARTDDYYTISRGKPVGSDQTAWIAQKDRTVLRHADMALSVSPEGDLFELNEFCLGAGLTPYKLISGKTAQKLQKWVAGKPGFTYGKAKDMALPGQSKVLTLTAIDDDPISVETLEAQDAPQAPSDSSTADTARVNPSEPSAQGKVSKPMVAIGIAVILGILALLGFILWRARRRK